MNQKEDYTLMNDTVIKYFLKSKTYRNWIYEIIKVKSGIDLNNYELYDNELNTGNHLKDYRTDCFLVDKKTKTKRVIIESNNSNEGGAALLKAYEYLFRVQGNSYLEGEEYAPKHTTLILFNNFLNPKEPTVKFSNYMLMDPINLLVRKDIDSFEFYLPLYHKVCYDEIEDEIEKRLYLMGVKNVKEFDNLNLKDDNLKIIKEYERLQKEDPMFIKEYEREIVEKKTRNTIEHAAERRGLLEGAKQANIETAKKMLEINIPIEQIVKCTGLDIKKIQKLKEEL